MLANWAHFLASVIIAHGRFERAVIGLRSVIESWTTLRNSVVTEVANAVGGIKEVVLVVLPLEQHTQTPFEALYPAKFARDLAEKINWLTRNPELRKRFGQAGRKRAVEKFSWQAVTAATKQIYTDLSEKNCLSAG